MTARAFITGVSGTALTTQERSFLREAEPWGLIVFKRNVETPEQVARAGRGLSRGGRPRRRARSGRSGRRSRAAARPAALAELSGGRALWANLGTRPGLGAGSRPHGGAPDRRRPHDARDRCGLPAARRRPGRRRRSRSSGTAPMGKAPRRLRPSPARSRTGSWKAACCRCSSICPATAAPPPTAMIGCPPSRPTARASRRWISPRSGRSPASPWG